MALIEIVSIKDFILVAIIGYLFFRMAEENIRLIILRHKLVLDKDMKGGKK